MSTESIGNSKVPATLSTNPVPGQPQEQLEVEETRAKEDEVTYPAGPKLWLNFVSLLICCVLRGLDLTIVAVAVPSLTNQFRTVQDIGWYNAAYMVVGSSTMFFFGKVYTVFDLRRTFLASIVSFWLSSILCTFAPSSAIFILGRACAGFSAGWQGGGLLNQMNAMFPLAKRPFYMGILNFAQTFAMVAAPIIGGGLIQTFGWRACFGINIPLGVLCFAFSWYGMHNTAENAETSLPLLEKVKRLDLTSTLVFIPALTCLLIALQWGGTKYGWNDPRIITLLVVSVALLAIFVYLQYHFGDEATVPLRIAKQRSIITGAIFCACCDGSLAVTENYISIYFQGVRGLSPAKSGLLGVPMIVGLCAASMVAGAGTTLIGYYAPFMIATSVLSPIASGLLTTMNLDNQVGKAAGLLGMLGFSLGVGMQAPLLAASCILKPKDLSVGNAILGFGAGMGSAMFTCAASLLFQTRLSDEIRVSAPGVNVTTIEHAGLSEIRSVIGQDRLRQVLTGYDKAVMQTLYIPLALTLLTLVGSSMAEWRSVKQKQT